MLKNIQLGPIGKKFQATIPANTWFAAKPLDEGSFCLVSCVVAPGFEFSDFEMGKRQELLAKYGQSQVNKDIITSLTRF
jgi:predicted cupin superfamily sugar epimerase